MKRVKRKRSDLPTIQPAGISVVGEAPLPKGWTFARIHQLCAINPGLVEPPDDCTQVSFIPMSAVSDESGEIVGTEVRPYSSVRSGFTQFADGDVIFAKITPCMENGKSAVARNLQNGIGCGSTEFIVCRSLGAILPEFLHRYMRQASYREKARLAMRGSGGQARVPKEFVEQTVLPVPPLEEQSRIIGALASLDARSREVRSHLADFPNRLLQTRKSLLTNAYDGSLTEDWRGGKKQNWRVLTIREVISDLQQGWSPRCDSSPALEHEWGVIKTTAIQPLVFSDEEHKALPSYRDPKPSLEIKAGDVLITRKGPRARAGVAAYVSKTRKKLMVCDTAYRLRTHESICEPKYLAYLLNYPQVMEELDKLKSGVSESGVGFTQSEFLGVAILLPPLSEQQEIIRRLDESLARLETAISEYRSAIVELDRFDEAVLARAFRGQLVAQREGDVPANVLIERLAAEVAAKPCKTRKRMPRKSKLHSREIRPILDVLQNSSSGLSPEELFHKCGRDEASLEHVENFYIELRQAIQDGKVEETRPTAATVTLRATL